MNEEFWRGNASVTLLKITIPLLLLSLSILVLQANFAEAQPLPQLLYVNLSLTRISQVFSANESSFQTNIAAEITYTGQDPPKWVGFSEGSVPLGGSIDFGKTPIAAFGNNTWTRIGTDTWKPVLMASGPYQLPGRYHAFVTGDVNSWPNENMSFIFAVVVSTVTVTGQPFRGPVTLNVDNLNAASIHYYYATPTVLANFTSVIFGTPVEGKTIRWDLSHEGTVVEGLVHVTILRIFYLPLITILSALTALKIGAICLRKKVSRLYQIATRYKTSTLAELIATLVVFIPLYDLAVAQYVPPWVRFFNDMMEVLFFSTLLLLFVSLFLVPFDSLGKESDV